MVLQFYQTLNRNKYLELFDFINSLFFLFIFLKVNESESAPILGPLKCYILCHIKEDPI